MRWEHFWEKAALPESVPGMVTYWGNFLGTDGSDLLLWLFSWNILYGLIVLSKSRFPGVRPQTEDHSNIIIIFFNILSRNWFEFSRLEGPERLFYACMSVRLFFIAVDTDSIFKKLDVVKWKLKRMETKMMTEMVIKILHRGWKTQTDSFRVEFNHQRSHLLIRHKQYTNKVT